MKLALAVVVFTVATLGLQTAALAAPRSEKIKAAVEYLSACGNFVRYDDENVYTGFGLYWTGHEKVRVPKPSILRFVPIDRLTEYQISTSDSVIDVSKSGTSTYVLTYSGIEEWDLTQFKRLGVYRTTSLSRALVSEEHPKAFAMYGDKLVIAHGRLGVSFFDLKTKKISRSVRVALSRQPLESVVNGIAVSGKYAYAVLDSYNLVGPHDRPAFRGLVIIDLETESVVSELDGMDPGADSVVADDKVAIVSFYGQPLWKYSLSSLMRSVLPMPMRRVWRFPIEGHPTGKASMDDQYYYTCFSRMPKDGEGPYFIKVPMVLDRRTLMLN